MSKEVGGASRQFAQTPVGSNAKRAGTGRGGALAGIQFLSDTTSAEEQCNLRLARFLRQDHSRPAACVLDVDVGPRFDQQAHDFRVTVLDRPTDGALPYGHVR